MENDFCFYSVLFTSVLGHEKEVFTIGTFEQVSKWAKSESSNYGFKNSVTYLTRDNLTGTVKNLCNY